MANRDRNGAPDRASVRVPGDILIHPVPLGAIAVLLLNDHVLKRVAPGWVTGKLSDVAGLIFFPFLLVALLEVGMRAARVAHWRAAPRTAWALAVVTGVGFALVKVWDPARDAYAFAIAALRWLWFALVAVVGREPLPGLPDVVVVRDATDLVALVGAVIAGAVLARVLTADPGQAREAGAEPGARGASPARVQSLM